MFDKPVLADCSFIVPGDPALKVPPVQLGGARLPYPPLVGDIVRFAGKDNTMRYIITRREFMVFNPNHGGYTCYLECKLYESSEDRA